MSHTLFLVFICLMLQQQWLTEAAKATCAFSEMDGVNATIRGEVNFEQNSPSENLTITVTNVTGLKVGNHGFHIHGNGNCKDPGSHFNPAKKDHGFIFESDRDYHIGDFGNIEIEENSILDKSYSVNSKLAGIFAENGNNVIGKVFVLHEGEDDLGLGDEDDSKTTGHAGRKMACCVITNRNTETTTTNPETTTTNPETTKQENSSPDTMHQHHFFLFLSMIVVKLNLF